jgi:molybdate transport system substrate-binding protein
MAAPTMLRLLCAGAAKGLVATLAPSFERETAAAIDGTFGAVGALRERIDAGEACDVVVLTAALVDVLAREGRVDAATKAPLGRVQTGVAVRAGDAPPDVANAQALREALVASGAIYVPDPERATAGIHFAAVLKRLGVDVVVATRIHAYPNGAAAMAALAVAPEPAALGCTQVSEILYTPGVALAGALPPGCELATLYAAAVATSARDPALAHRFVDLLTGAATRGERAAAGFEA